jgi:hypothetical protein
LAHCQAHLDAGSIPMLEISLAFLGKTYLLVGSIINFTQLSIGKPSPPFRRSARLSTRHLA